MCIHCSNLGKKPQNPTAQRLGEILAEWQPNTVEGLYHQYLQLLSPGFDHVLIYSRYDRICRQKSPIGWKSNISLLAAPVHVVNRSNNGEALGTRSFEGASSQSMNDLHSFLSNTGDSKGFRMICAQHLTSFSIETLGSALSLDPNVLGHHIGTSYKSIEACTGFDKLGDMAIGHIRSSVGDFERDRNLQIVRKRVGRLSHANVNHAKDDVLRKSVRRPTKYSPADPSITFSISIPRTIYVQGYHPEDEKPGFVGRGMATRVLGLQDRILCHRYARQRFCDNDFACDQGERYSQNALDIVQHVTVQIKMRGNTSRPKEGKCDTHYGFF